MEYILANLKYLDVFSSNAKLIKNANPKEGQTVQVLTQAQIDGLTYPLTTRNPSGATIIQIDKEKSWLNYIPRKTVINDDQLSGINDYNFLYFVDDVIVPPDKFILADGQIFRCAGDGGNPLNPETLTYYIVQSGKAKRIPNYKTLEVMLTERNLSLNSVRVLEDNQCMDIEKEGDFENKSNLWTEDMKDQSNFAVLKSLENKAKDANEIAGAAKASADQQIAAVKAQAEQSKAEADAAKAKSAADKAAADAAIAAAAAAQAAAEAAKAQADLEKAKIQNA